MNDIGTKLITDDLLDVFEASEGTINMYYGLIGNGKTYAATSDILDLLEQGKVVYCNWRIVVKDFDQRKSFKHLFLGLIFPWKRTYYLIPREKNLHYFDPEAFASTGELVEWLSKLNDCHIFLTRDKTCLTLMKEQSFRSQRDD